MAACTVRVFSCERTFPRIDCGVARVRVDACKPRAPGACSYGELAKAAKSSRAEGGTNSCQHDDGHEMPQQLMSRRIDVAHELRPEGATRERAECGTHAGP